MCLTIPKQVISVKGSVVCVRSAKGQQEVGSLVKAKKGDWVLTQNDVIIRKISQKQAEEIDMLMSSRGAKRRRDPVR
ncbi:MAG: HypC/HybG/HupF family hydrogenase formation chaperone [bacterium]